MLFHNLQTTFRKSPPYFFCGTAILRALSLMEMARIIWKASQRMEKSCCDLQSPPFFVGMQQKNMKKVEFQARPAMVTTVSLFLGAKKTRKNVSHWQHVRHFANVSVVQKKPRIPFRETIRHIFFHRRMKGQLVKNFSDGLRRFWGAFLFIAADFQMLDATAKSSITAAVRLSLYYFTLLYKKNFASGIGADVPSATSDVHINCRSRSILRFGHCVDVDASVSAREFAFRVDAGRKKILLSIRRQTSL